MNTFESKSLSIDKPQEEIYNYLSDFRNFGKLMPEEITNWKANATNCSFTISNMADLNMAYGKSIPSERIIMVSEGKNPFEYDLNVLIDAIDGTSSQAKIIFNADLNPMLAMMATTPLKNFIDMLVEKLKIIMSSL